MSTGFGLKSTELCSTTFPAFREGMQQSDQEGIDSTPRSYPGYPFWPLPRKRGRLWPSLDKALLARRSERSLSDQLPSPPVLGRLLRMAHGISSTDHKGPVPSAGGLQALELYLAVLTAQWLPTGCYHYDRQKHGLAQIREGNGKKQWEPWIPSFPQVQGGSLLWIVAGDGRKAQSRYGERGHRFLLLEAGHLMQNLCLLSHSLGLSTVPLGGFFEEAIAREMQLLKTDLVLYVGICGRPLS